MAAPTIDQRWLFVKTCQDLLGKQRSSEYYDKLQMAPLLRHLLVGPRSLVASANRELGKELEFWFREPDADVATRPWESAIGFDASRREIAHGEVRKTGLEPFLTSRVAYFGEWFTVQQLIDTVAHAYGGQYAVLPDGVSHQGLAAFDEAAKKGAAGPVSVALHEITGVALRGLIPLANPSGEPRPAKKPRPAPPSGSGGGCPFSGATG